MRKYLKHIKTGFRYELSPLTHAEFISLGLWSGLSAIAFTQWLQINNLHEIGEIVTEAINDYVIEIQNTHRNYEFDPTGCGDWNPVESKVTGIQPLSMSLTKKKQPDIVITLGKTIPEVMQNLMTRFALDADRAADIISTINQDPSRELTHEELQEILNKCFMYIAQKYV